MKSISIYPPILDGKDIQAKREEIKKYFHNTFDLFEKMFELFKDDSVFYKKSELTRHPMIFYFGHTATFFINKLILMKIIKQRINPEFESIFAIGVDEMNWDDLDENNYNWPNVNEVRKYRKKVKELVDKLIMSIEFSLPIRDDSDMWIILMGIEHERIHIETSSVLHRQMPIEFIKELSEFNICKEYGDAPVNSMLHIKASDVLLGKSRLNNLYGWDNEYGSYYEYVGDFQVSKYIVSNGEFMEFVKSGGYEQNEFWDEEGRKFLEISGAKHPPFWIKENDTYKYRSLTKIINMPMNWPVDVNALEAMAFCRWKSKKDNLKYVLPSEAEYMALQDYVGIKDIPALDDSKANLNFAHYFSSSPVDKFMFKEFGDVIGNVWQWSRSTISGFDGFRVHKAYDDFSVPTFDNKHALILGSSWASSGNLIMKYSRYAFRRHFYQHSGFRYVISNEKNKNEIDIYESDSLVSQYCEFQYGSENFGIKNFSIACAEIASKFTNYKSKALDIGCATGRGTFELAKIFDKVEGIDFSVRFVQIGSKLKNDGYIAYTSKTEGNLFEKKRFSIDELGYKDLLDKVAFWQGDACNLKPNFNSYDLVMATNIIDRLYNPMLFLNTIKERINENGILIITSPYTWQESSTETDLWLGGFEDDNGEEIRTIDTLKNILEDTFTLIHIQDLEFVIKETARKYQHSIAQVSVWQKNEV